MEANRSTRPPRKRLIRRPSPDEAIAQVEGILQSLARRRFPHLGEADREDLVQRCRVHLWRKSLPKFKPSRGVRWTTFAYQCIHNWLRGECRTVARRAVEAELCRGGESVTHRPAPSEPDDDAALRAFAVRVREFGGDFLAPGQTVLVRTMARHPTATLEQIARRLRRPVASVARDVLDARRRILAAWERSRRDEA